jgi:hypothetical protein
MFNMLGPREPERWLLHVSAFIATFMFGGSVFVVSTYFAQFKSPDTLQQLFKVLPYQNEFFAQLSNALGFLLLPSTVVSFWRKDNIIYVVIGTAWFYLSWAWVSLYFIPAEQKINSLADAGQSCAGGSYDGAPLDLAAREHALQQFVVLCACRAAAAAMVAVALFAGACCQYEEDTADGVAAQENAEGGTDTDATDTPNVETKDKEGKTAT